MRGTVSVDLDDVRDGFSSMTISPESAFNCGPLAVARLLRDAGKTDAAESFEQSKGTGEGFLVRELLDMAEVSGESLVAMRRTATADKILLPAVVHWQSEHYAYVEVSPIDGMVRVIDPTFRINGLYAISDVIDESSGVFLMLACSLENGHLGYVELSDEECSAIVGRGGFGSSNKDDDKDPCDKKKKSCGMPTCDFDTFWAALELYDTPLPIASPLGPDLSSSLHYPDNSKASVFGNNPQSSIGTKWAHTFSSFVRKVPSNSRNMLVYLLGGQQETYFEAEFDSNNLYHDEVITLDFRL